MSTKVYNLKYTPDELNNRIERLIQYCEDNDEYPDTYITLTVGGISDDDEINWLKYYNLTCDDDATAEEKDVINKKIALSVAIKKLRAYREHRSGVLVRGNPKLIPYEAFRQKQDKYGGWRDRFDHDSNVTYTLSLGKIDASEAFG